MIPRAKCGDVVASTNAIISTRNSGVAVCDMRASGSSRIEDDGREQCSRGLEEQRDGMAKK